MKVAIIESKVYKPEHIAIDPYQSKGITKLSQGSSNSVPDFIFKFYNCLLKYFELQEESFDQVLTFIGYIYLLNENGIKLKASMFG